MRNENAHWPAPAKLNLFLHITGRRSDGYHTLQTAFQFVDWCDWLTFSINQTGEITRTGNLELKENEDLCLRAARLLKKTSKTKFGATIELDKNLPIGGGLGGGSSDAATTLLALNKFWNLDFSREELAKLGLELGADVPVFIQGQAAFAEGVGEQLQAIELETPWFVILVPQVEVLTARIFADPELTHHTPAITIRDFYESLSASENKLENRLNNDLESVVRRHYPPVDNAMTWLAQFGPARLTGSGACVFLPVENRYRAEEIAKQCPHGMVCRIARGLNAHPVHDLGLLS